MKMTKSLFNSPKEEEEEEALVVPEADQEVDLEDVEVDLEDVEEAWEEAVDEQRKQSLMIMISMMMIIN
jgi:hypothetical protein